MKKILIFTLIFTLPFISFSQKRSKKNKSKEDITATKLNYEFMIIKGIEVERIIDKSKKDIGKKMHDTDLSLEKKMKRLLMRPTRLLVSFDNGDMRDPQIRELMKKSNEFRTMGAAVKEAAKYGWKFINSNVVSTVDGTMHYFYMKREK
tara:strand:- start:675 stop:1121 length:447 start_codon:yes stop_codon:yes gene_type:complete